MNALELLKEEHQRVQELFEQVKATENERQHKRLYKISVVAGNVP